MLPAYRAKSNNGSRTRGALNVQSAPRNDTNPDGASPTGDSSQVVTHALSNTWSSPVLGAGTEHSSLGAPAGRCRVSHTAMPPWQ